MVLAAAGRGPNARAALESLCETYWLPVYGYVRSRSKTVDDAQDRTQQFFADLLDRNALAAADPTRGRFRAFLLTSLKNFLINQHAYDAAQKRGGGRGLASLDFAAAEGRLSGLASSDRTPEQEFERRWALTLIQRVLEKLAAEQQAAGRAREFAALQPFLTGQEASGTLVDVARSLGTTAEAVRAAVYRLRNRYRTLLRAEVAQTTNSPEDVDDELQNLIAAVSA